MPELPEVETSCRGIAPHIEGQTVTALVVRNRKLRWPISRTLDKQLPGSRIESVTRRAKYILINTNKGTAILHLGMSGSVYIIDSGTAAAVHDHVDIELADGKALRLTDPRRFGSLHWSRQPLQHALLAKLGPEPLGSKFDGQYLWTKSRGRKVSVKQFIMNAEVVVGVGNIYASESLFIAGIHPKRPAGRIALHRYERLAQVIKDVLGRAIRAGGTTLRDFYGGDGEPGYFKQELQVYDREDEECRVCAAPIRAITQGQRSTYYCRYCQT